MVRMLKCAALGLPLFLTICVFVPLLIYSGNPQEFTASFTEILRILVPYGLVLVMLSGLTVFLLNDAGMHRFAAVISALAILAWLQGNILVWDYGPLDGRSINWLLGIGRGVLDTALWTALIVLSVRAHKRFGRWLVQGAIATVAIQVVAIVPLLTSSDAGSLTRSDVQANAQGKREVLRFSDDFNVLHIVMDGFQTDIFKALVNDPANSANRELLRGFTLFEDNLGPYPYTQMSVPALLTGKLYHNQVPAEEFINTVLQDKTILGAAIDAGFEVDIAAPVGVKNVYAKSAHTNAYGIASSDHVSPQQLIDSESARAMDLSLFRVVPHFTKALVYREDRWLFQERASDRSYQHIQYFADLALIRELTQNLSVDRRVPVYKMMHLMLSHRPTVGNEECEYDGRRRTNRENVTIQAGCALKAVLELFARMQELGIFDNSLIVLMADHGAWVPVEGLAGDDAVVNAVEVAMATPVLAIKRPGEKHDFRTSMAPTTITDLPATIADVLQLEATFAGESVFELDAESVRERRHFNYVHGRDAQNDGYLLRLREFLVSGSPYDLSAWQRGHGHLPAGKIVESGDVD